MPSQFVDPNAASYREGFPATKDESPRGVILPPPCVREIVEKEKAKFGQEFAHDETWQSMTDSLTLQYYFDHLGHDVLYRCSPEGPEVLAVGFEEVREYVKDMPVEEQLKLKTWTP